MIVQKAELQSEIYVFQQNQETDARDAPYPDRDNFEACILKQNIFQRQPDTQIIEEMQHPQGSPKNQLKDEVIQFDQEDQVYIGEDIEQQKNEPFQKSIEKTEDNTYPMPRVAFKEIDQNTTENLDFSNQIINPRASRKKLEENNKQSDNNSLNNQKQEQIPRIVGLSIYKCLQSTTIQIKNKKAFLVNPIPSGVILNCKLRRTKNFMSLLYPEFDFYIENGLKHIISAQKRLLANTECFVISSELGQYSKEFNIASIKANIPHNQYVILGKQQGTQNKFKFVYGEINYGKLKNKKQQRDMTLSIPYKVSVGVKVDHLNSFTFETIEDKYKINLMSKFSQNCKSDKPFSLIDQQQDDYNYLKFQKESDNIFNIFIQHPLTPLQAFGAVLTRFDAQLK